MMAGAVISLHADCLLVRYYKTGNAIFSRNRAGVMVAGVMEGESAKMTQQKTLHFCTFSSIYSVNNF